MIVFIDMYRDHFSVEFICKVLNAHRVDGFLTSRGYRAAKTRLPSARTVRDEKLVGEVKRIYAENYSVYGVRKMWQAMRRAGWEIGRDQTARLMRLAGVKGVRRGRKPITTRPPAQPDARPDLVKRQFTAERPNQLWVADITYVKTVSGFVYTAFVTDVFSRKIVGWATRSSLTTEALPLEALEQAIQLAQGSLKGLIHHSDHGTQYVSTKYIKELTDNSIQASTGSVGDSYDNALAETVNGLYKTELIYTQSWQSLTEVEFATLNWVHWWNHQRLHESLNYHAPAEVLAAYNQTQAKVLAHT